MVTYTNRRGNQYYLHVGETKTGKNRYYVSTDPEGASEEPLPKGYEIYENPNAQVFVRRKRPVVFTPAEVRTVDTGVRKLSAWKPYQYKIEAKGKAITVHEICQDLEGLASLVNPWAAKDKALMAKLAAETGSYDPIMRFCLTDKKRRVFQAERFCFLGGIDDWIPIGMPGQLSDLVEEFAVHLGRESFYELM